MRGHLGHVTYSLLVNVGLNMNELFILFCDYLVSLLIVLDLFLLVLHLLDHLRLYHIQVIPQTVKI